MTRANPFILGAVGMAVLLGNGVAAADPSTTVQLVMPECETPPVDPSELAEAIRVELASLGVRIATDESEPSAKRVTLSLPECSQDATEIRVEFEFTGRSQSSMSVRATLPLADVPPETRPRTIAVAVAELVRVIRPVPDSAPPTDAAVEQPEQPDTAEKPEEKAARKQAARRPRPLPPVAQSHAGPGRLSFGIGAQMQWLASGQDAFMGGFAEVAGEVIRGWIPRAGVGATQNSAASHLGAIDVVVVGATLGWDAIVLRDPLLTLGPELSASLVRASGESIIGLDEPSQTSWIALAGGRLGLGVPVLRHLRLQTGLNLDWTARELVLTSAGRAAVELSGLAGGLMLGFAYVP